MNNRLSYNPDVLSCLANLSNDEVFTPPQLANQMLDMLPQELFRSPDTKFLDPCTKSGVFLREIAKRLIEGLADTIPDLQQRIDHIMHHQLYGIAITRLTSMMSRRSLYCSKSASGKYSISQFDDEAGNIRYRDIKHSWVQGKCKYCGASQEVYDRGEDLESHAYEFIHTDNPKTLYKNMTFDVIIGNPPYQLSKATENSTNSNAAFASAIYPLFIDQALKLSPRFLIMITPSRWMTKSGQGISNEWVERMIRMNHFMEIHDFIDSTDCFNGVDIMGGVSYFLLNPSYIGKCKFVCHRGKEISTYIDFLDSFKIGMVIRDPKSIEIIKKVSRVEGDYYKNKSFADIVSPLHFYDKSGKLSSNWKGYTLHKDAKHNIKYYLNKKLVPQGFAWISKADIPKNEKTINIHKVYIPEANGSKGENSVVLGTPFYGESGSVCSQTYLVIGYNKEFVKDECYNVLTYIKTKFFRYMVSILKNTQHAPNSVYQFVPLQDFSKPWTDEELYKKYGLTDEEIQFIESMIRPME